MGTNCPLEETSIRGKSDPEGMERKERISREGVTRRAVNRRVSPSEFGTMTRVMGVKVRLVKVVIT